MFILQVVIFQLFIFAVLIIVMRQIISKKVTIDKAQLQKLSEVYIEKEKELRDKQEEGQQKYNELLDKARKEAIEIRARAQTEAKSENERIMEQARAQSEQIIKRAEKCGEEVKKDIDEHIRRHAADKACELIRDILPEEIRKKMHTQCVKELIEKGFTALEHMQIPEESKEAIIVTPYKLSPEETNSILKGIEKYVKHKIIIKEEVNEKIISGIKVSIGSLVLDGSILDRAKRILEREIEDKS